MVSIRRLLDKKRISRHQFQFLLLLLGAISFFFYTNINETGWSTTNKQLNESKELLIQFIRQNIISHFTNGSEVVSKVIQQVVHPHSTRPTPVPYVSPGPYLVEYPYEYHFTINEPLTCEQEKPFVVLMVPVAPHNRAHRDVIRSTWGSERLVLDKVVRLFFLLGMQTGDDAQQVHKQLLQESNEHQDLIQSDFVDCYKNLTIKTMVMLEWLDSFCSNASYAMKIDSDMFLHVPNLVKMLLNAPTSNYLTGLVAYNGAVLRDPSSKWYLPPELFSPPVYPPYALGLGYILSLDLTKKLIEASRHVKAVYIEDVYLGLCMMHLGMSPTNPPEQGSFRVLPLTYYRCTFSDIIATTTEPYVDRVWLWTEVKRQSQYCALVKERYQNASFFQKILIILLKVVNLFISPR